MRTTLAFAGPEAQLVRRFVVPVADDVRAGPHLGTPRDALHDEHGQQIAGIGATHFASLTFTPATLATVAAVDGEHRQ